MEFSFIELAQKREDAVQTNQRLQSEAQVVLDVIEREEVAQALRQDKLQNLNYLSEHYNVKPSYWSIPFSLFFPLVNPGANISTIYFWPVSVYIWKLFRRSGLSIPF